MKEPKTFKDFSHERLNLLIQRTGYRFPYNIIPDIKFFFKKIKWSYQRLTRGYSDWDLRDFDLYLKDLLACSLNDFAKITQSYPNDRTFEEWQNFIFELSNLFFEGNPTNIWSNYYENKSPNSIDQEREEEEKALKKFAEAWSLLGEHLSEMWY